MYICTYIYMYIYIYVNINFSCYICILYIHQHVRLTFCILSKRLPSLDCRGYEQGKAVLVFLSLSIIWLLTAVLFLLNVIGKGWVFRFVMSTNSVPYHTQRGWDEFTVLDVDSSSFFVQCNWYSVGLSFCHVHQLSTLSYRTSLRWVQTFLV